MKKRQYEQGENKLEVLIRARVTQAERDKFKAYAESKGTTLSKLIIDLLEAEMRNEVL